MPLLNAHTLVVQAQGPQIVQEELLHGHHWPGGAATDLKGPPDLNELPHDLLRLNVVRLAEAAVKFHLLTAHDAGWREQWGQMGAQKG